MTLEEEQKVELSAERRIQTQTDSNSPTCHLAQDQIEVEFGGLHFDFHPIQANEQYLKWIEDNTVVRPHAGDPEATLEGVQELVQRSKGKPLKRSKESTIACLRANLPNAFPELIPGN